MANFSSVSVATNTAAAIVTANSRRISLIVTNIGVGSAFLGDTSSVTSANGIMLRCGGSLAEDSGGTRVYMGDIYAIAGSVGTTVTYWQRIRGSG